MPPARRADSVPKELVGKYIREFCSRYPDHPRHEGFIAPHQMLANRSGLDPSFIRKLATDTLPYNVSFDAADKIFCAIGNPYCWHGDPELRKIYYSRVVAEADRLKPIEVAA